MTNQLALADAAARRVDAPASSNPNMQRFDASLYQVADVRGLDSKQVSAEKAIERINTAGSGSDQLNTKQFPSDSLFYKAINANPEWAKAPWKATNPAQEELLKSLKDPKVAELAKQIPADMLDATAGDTKSVNDFLQRKGFNRLLQERPNEEAVAATFNIKRDWKAEKSTVTVGEKTYAAIDKSNSKIYNVDGKPVVELYKDLVNADGITIYAIPNERGLNGFQAMQEAKRLIPKANESQPQETGNVRIPMIDFSAQEKLGFLLGMKGGDRTIGQAFMQTTLKMDENGFDAKQALAVSTFRGMKIPQEPKFTFNTDFTFVVAKDGQPIFAQTISKESWKDPKRQ